LRAIFPYIAELKVAEADPYILYKAAVAESLANCRGMNLEIGEYFLSRGFKVSKSINTSKFKTVISS
jgi:hypothetical protein